MKHITLFIALLLVGGLSRSIDAQQSHPAATYRLADTQAIDGTVVMVAFTDSRSFVHIEAPDRDGVMRRWSAEWVGGRELRRHGMTRSTLRPGDHVSVVGHPGRNADAFQLLIVGISRASDDWTWGDRDLDS